jgi:hypothetical protein
MIKPAVKKNAPRLWTVKLLRSSLLPIHATPTIAMFLAPQALTILELIIAIAEIIDALIPPMNDSTAGVDKPCSTRTVWTTPQAYVVPTAHHDRTAHDATMIQP